MRLSSACDGGALSVAGAWRKGLMAREVDVVRRSTDGRSEGSFGCAAAPQRLRR